MQLSQKQRTVSQFFSTFLKCRLNFEHSEKSIDDYRWFNSEVTASEKPASIDG